MRSWAQGELCSCELLMNAAPLGLVVGRASGGASAVFGLVAARGSGWGGTVAGGVGREVDGENGELARGVGTGGAVLLGSKADVTALVGDEGGAEEFDQ